MTKAALTLLFLSFPALLTALMLLCNNIILFIYLPLLSVNLSHIELSLTLDWMSLTFAATVMLITSAIIAFSAIYIPPTEHNRFLLILLAFMLSMLLLIFSNNTIFLMLGWDGLGLSSYALVIYYQNATSAASGAITILSNRVGDITILLAIATLLSLNSWDFTLNNHFSLSTMLLLGIAAISKSAQFPFSAWLPAAMAAPTPISALVHSSTLVTAGVYLTLRIANTPHPLFMWNLLLISILTTFMAGLAALWEQDMKKIIALSTLSQIAIMMFALALSLHQLAFFHLVTHAIFKSTMFLCAGMMIHNSNYQDMRALGSSFSSTPILSTTLGVSATALMGFPFMAGFYSKDAIMESMLLKNINPLIWTFMLSAIGLTIAYSFRLILTAQNFSMKSKADLLISSNPVMSASLYLMAPLAIMTGATLSWLTIPTQFIHLSTSSKLSTLMILSISTLFSMVLHYKSKTHATTGQLALSLWFLHPLTTTPSLKLLYTGKQAFLSDLTWHEQSSAQGLYKYALALNYYPSSLAKSPMTLMVLITILPLFFLY